MSLTLQDAFDQYKGLTDDSLRQQPRAARVGVVRLVHDSNRLLRESVATLEETEAFKALVVATRTAFHPKPSRGDHSLWEHAAKNFFRRSGLYATAAAGNSIDGGQAFARYTSAFRSTERVVTYLAPIEHVKFAADCLDLGAFQVRRFTKADLERMLEVDINRIFYQWGLTDVGVLADYWYVTLNPARNGSSLSARGAIFSRAFSLKDSSNSCGTSRPSMHYLVTMLPVQRIDSRGGSRLSLERGQPQRT